jgi:hypothetical protein
MAVDIQKMFNETLPAAMAGNPDAAKEIGVAYQLDVTGEGGGQWFVDCTATGPRIESGNPGKAECTVTMTAPDFQLLMEAVLHGQAQDRRQSAARHQAAQAARAALDPMMVALRSGDEPRPRGRASPAPGEALARTRPRSER